MQVSDQGSHFKNKVFHALNQGLRVRHHFTVAYSPWSNGSIEIIVKDFETTLKKLRLETNVPARKWFTLIPMIQFALNHSPRADKAGYAPIEIMTGAKPNNPLDAVLSLFSADFSTKALSLEALSEHVEKLQLSLSQIHRSVDLAVSGKRDYQRRRLNSKKKSKSANFGLGDFVLVAIPQSKIRNKMQVIWKGPMMIVEVLTDWIFKVQCLDSEKTEIVHSQRLRFYSETLHESVLEYVQTNEDDSEFYQVDYFVDIRSSKSGYEILVHWLGFTEHERTWEPILSLYEDTPLLLPDFLLEKKMDKVWMELRQ